GGREDLMVVNLNQLNNVSFAPTLPGYTEGTPAEVWEWNSTNTTGLSGNDIAPASSGPTPQFFPSGLPSNWTIPEQAVALFEAVAGGHPVVGRRGQHHRHLLDSDHHDLPSSRRVHDRAGPRIRCAGSFEDGA